ncbi:hypothetical protein HPB51_001407 [Rhipicephalus microplus]|uniref:Uncharacterized protein n=1 Tax=Rhipicephalus microplus TaxID=6941 RepID=A0A9J6EF18_RHIMP|nr:hypothetical protein HPB51_001407 [Rhipicephalus microplus]
MHAWRCYEGMENTCANACDEFHEANKLQKVGNQQKGETETATLRQKTLKVIIHISGLILSSLTTQYFADLSSDSDELEDDCAMASPPAQAKNKKALTQEEFQHEVLVRLTALRMVQKQHGELLHGLIGRFRSNAAKENAPLVSSPFSEYESLKLFDDKLTGQMKDTLDQLFVTSSHFAS